MSKHETLMTEGFWQAVAHGAFIAEYPLVFAAADRSPRRVDALILPDKPHGRAYYKDHRDISGQHVIVVQTKPGRMGMYLMGQALFSGLLAREADAASVRSILLCHRTDAALLPLLAAFPEVEVWVSDPENPLACQRA